jgi:hypothetical protein
MGTRYTVYKCKSMTSDEQVGSTHYSNDAESTLCGKDVNEYWYICDNRFTGVATCRKCVAMDKTTKELETRYETELCWI